MAKKINKTWDEEDILVYPQDKIEPNYKFWNDSETLDNDKIEYDFELDEAVSDNYDLSIIEDITDKLNCNWRRINDRGAGVMKDMDNESIYFYDIRPNAIKITSLEEGALDKLYDKMEVIENEYDIIYKPNSEAIYIKNERIESQPESLNENKDECDRDLLKYVLKHIYANENKIKENFKSLNIISYEDLKSLDNNGLEYVLELEDGILEDFDATPIKDMICDIIFDGDVNECGDNFLTESEDEEDEDDEMEEIDVKKFADQIGFTWREKSPILGLLYDPKKKYTYWYHRDELEYPFIEITNACNEDDDVVIDHLYEVTNGLEDFEITRDGNHLFVENKQIDESLNEDNSQKEQGEYVEAFNKLKSISDRIGADEFLNEFISYLGEKKALDIAERIENRNHVDNKIDDQDEEEIEIETNNDSDDVEVKEVGMSAKESLNEADEDEEEVKVKKHKIDLDNEDGDDVVLDDIEKSDEIEDDEDDSESEDFSDISIFRNFIQNELSKKEPDRSEVTFSADNVTYKGYPLAKIDNDHYLFKVDEKTKKVDITRVDLDNIFVKDKLEDSIESEDIE